MVIPGVVDEAKVSVDGAVDGAVVTGWSTQKSPTMTASTGQHASLPHFNAKVSVSLVQ